MLGFSPISAAPISAQYEATTGAGPVGKDLQLIWDTLENATGGPPDLIQRYDSAATWGGNGSNPQTITGIVVNAGDRIVVIGGCENFGTGVPSWAVSDSGSNTWTTSAHTPTGGADAGKCHVFISTATASANATISVTYTNGATYLNAFSVYVFRNSDGFGAATSSDAGVNSPNVSLTTTQDNSTILWFAGDWNAVTSTPVYRTGFGTATEDKAFQGNSTNWGARLVRHADAGTAGTSTFGISSGDSGTQWHLAGIEVKGTTGGGLSAVGDTLQLVWNDNAVVNDSLQTIWNDRAVVSDTLQAIWLNLVNVSDTSQFVWTTLNPVNDSLQTLWNDQALVTKNLQSIWNLNAVLGDTVQVLWNDKTSVNDSLQAIWNQYTTVNDTLQLLWNDAFALQDNVQLIWNVEVSGVTAVGKDLQVIWNMGSVAGDTLQSLWNVRAPVADTLQAVWNDRATVPDTLQIVWGDLTSVSDTLQSIWNVSVSVSDTLGLVWHDRATVQDALQLIWNALGNLVATSDLTLLWNVELSWTEEGATVTLWTEDGELLGTYVEDAIVPVAFTETPDTAPSIWTETLPVDIPWTE